MGLDLATSESLVRQLTIYEQQYAIRNWSYKSQKAANNPQAYDKVLASRNNSAECQDIIVLLDLQFKL